MIDHAMPAATPTQRASSWGRLLTVENLLWLTFITVAFVTRFWDLGYRTQHHDESLHTYYSWLWSTGERSYVHHPLTHGPFLFHLNALVYWLGERIPFIGVNDASSRYMPAIAGVLTVWMPWLLRGPRFLGRWGALAASFMLLISPAMMYYTRYIRHDPYMVLGCLLLTVALFRYFERPQRRWLFIAFVTVACLLANHELVLATFLIMCVVLWGSLLLTHLRSLIPAHVLALVLLAVAAMLWRDEPFPPIPWQRSAERALDFEQATNYLLIFMPAVIAFLVALGAIWLIRNRMTMGIVTGVAVVFGIAWLIFSRDRLPEVPSLALMLPDQETTYLTTNQFYSALFQHPLVQAVLAIAVVFILGCALTLRWVLDGKPDDVDGIDYMLGDAKPNTVSYGLRYMLKDVDGLAIAIFLGVATWIVLFTSWFTNMGGIGTGTYETNSTLLYWLGQHDVQRGKQPWFYFITLGLQYEWLGIFVSLAGSIVLGWGLLRWIAGRDLPANTLWKCFTVAWFLGMLVVLSWAGEKMPWLIMHITLPAVLVGGWLINDLVTGAFAWYRQPHRASLAERYGAIGLTTGLLLLSAGWLFTTARHTYGAWVVQQIGTESTWTRQVPQDLLDSWWTQAVPPLIAMFLIAIGIWVIGPRKAMYSTLVAAFVAMSMFQVHAAMRMNFVDGDLAVDTMIYNTIGPDVNQVVHDVEELSYLVYGDDSIHVVFDSCSMQWPQHWYFRNTEFPNASMGQYSQTGTPDVILTGQETTESCWPSRIPGYTPQVYFMRVHESERATYRNFAIAPELPAGWSAWQTPEQPHDIGAVVRSVWSSVEYVTTVDGQQRLIRLVMYRDPAAKQTVWLMTVWVRDDLLPQYNEIRYGETQP